MYYHASFHAVRLREPSAEGAGWSEAEPLDNVLPQCPGLKARNIHPSDRLMTLLVMRDGGNWEKNVSGFQPSVYANFSPWATLRSAQGWYVVGPSALEENQRT
jgi:hypothetical protein